MFTQPNAIEYSYQLEGFDRDWQPTDAARRFASYTNLDPGAYTFRVKASNNDGVWNEEGVAVRLTVLPPWWSTNGFRALVTVLFIGLLWAAYKVRVRQLQQQFALALNARVGERTRIARELHDTLLQTFHALALKFQGVLNLLPDRPADAKRRLEAALQQADQAIVEGRNAVQGLRASTAEHNDLANAIRRLCDNLAREAPDGAEPRIGVLVEGASRDLHPIVRDEIYKIAVEAIRNAVHHARAVQIDVELRYEPKHLRLVVRDDGAGIEAAVATMGKEGHYGLRGMSERASVIGGRLVVWSQPHVGTEIELRVPWT